MEKDEVISSDSSVVCNNLNAVPSVDESVMDSWVPTVYLQLPGMMNLFKISEIGLMLICLLLTLMFCFDQLMCNGTTVVQSVESQLKFEWCFSLKTTSSAFW